MTEQHGTYHPTRRAADPIDTDATASDLTRVIVGGGVVVSDGVLASGEEPAQLLARSLEAFS